MPVLGIAMISSSQFNRKRGHNSTETKRRNVQFLLKHFIPAIPLAWVFVGFFQLSPFKFYLGRGGLAQPSHP